MKYVDAVLVRNVPILTLNHILHCVACYLCSTTTVIIVTITVIITIVIRIIVILTYMLFCHIWLKLKGLTMCNEFSANKNCSNKQTINYIAHSLLLCDHPNNISTILPMPAVFLLKVSLYYNTVG